MCKNPLVGYPYLVVNSEGVKKWRYQFEPLFKACDKERGFGYFPSPESFSSKGVPARAVDPDTGEVREAIQCGCGNCSECRLSYSRVWADRCMMEAASYDPGLNWFVTLTYDPGEEPRLVSEKSGLLSLLPDDLTRFVHNLRQNSAIRGYQSDGIRIFAAGEYGDNSQRPHFHVLLFNTNIPDVEMVAKNFRGDVFFRSDFLEKCWKHGFVSVAHLSWETAAYTARYVMKKRKGKEKAYYDAAGIQPEFVRMSRRPGIGREWIEQHRNDFFEYGRTVLPDSKGRTAFAARYVRNVLCACDPLSMARRLLSEEAARQEMTEARRDASTLTDAEFFRLRGEGSDKIAKILAGYRNLQKM